MALHNGLSAGPFQLKTKDKRQGQIIVKDLPIKSVVLNSLLFR